MKTNWEEIVREFAKQDGKSFSEEMKWLSQRDSLQTAVECMGQYITGGRSGEKECFESFGSFLDRRGYSVPPLWCPLNEYAYDTASRVGETMSVKKRVDEYKRRLRDDEASASDEYHQKVVIGITLTEAVIKASINELVKIAEPTPENEIPATITQEILAQLAIAKERGFDVASDLVKRLREVAG